MLKRYVKCSECKAEISFPNNEAFPEKCPVCGTEDGEWIDEGDEEE